MYGPSGIRVNASRPGRPSRTSRRRSARRSAPSAIRTHGDPARPPSRRARGIHHVPAERRRHERQRRDHAVRRRLVASSNPVRGLLLVAHASGVINRWRGARRRLRTRASVRSAAASAFVADHPERCRAVHRRGMPRASPCSSASVVHRAEPAGGATNDDSWRLLRSAEPRSRRRHWRAGAPRRNAPRFSPTKSSLSSELEDSARRASSSGPSSSGLCLRSMRIVEPHHLNEELLLRSRSTG